MDQDRQMSILSCLLPDTLVEEQLVDSYTQTLPQTYVGTPVRVVYVNTAEQAKPPQTDAEEEEDCWDEEEKNKTRVSHPEKWRQNVRKKNKNQGLAYVRANGEFCAEKEMGPACTCRMKCYYRLGIPACEKVFKNFWKLGDHSLQNAYIAGCVRIMLPKLFGKKAAVKKDSPGRRIFTRSFYVNVNGVDTEICKLAFLNMHSISNGRLDRVLKRKQESGNTGVDARGRHSNKVNKIPLSKIREVRRHIDSYRKKEGFTGKRKSKTVELLPATLNIRTMFRSYKEDQQRKGLEPVCEFRYRKIFHSDFHIDFVRTPAVAQATPSPLPPPPPEPLKHVPTPLPPIQVLATLDDKPVYTTLESSCKDETATTFVTLNTNDFYSGSYTLQPQNWMYSGQP